MCDETVRENWKRFIDNANQQITSEGRIKWVNIPNNDQQQQEEQKEE